MNAVSPEHLPSVVAFSCFAFVSSTTAWVAVPFCMSIFRELALFCEIILRKKMQVDVKII